MIVSVRRVVLVAGLLSMSAFSMPAQAASPFTNAFLANVRSNVAFLDRSSRLASERSTTTAIRDYAKAETSEALRMAELLDGVAPGERAVASADTGALMTGRSVSVEGAAGSVAQAANGRAPMGDVDVEGLSQLSGRKFIDAFWLKQVDALSQLRADYQAYIDDGDDSALIALAKRELPAVERRLATLSKI